jgi:hypothetical protein
LENSKKKHTQEPQSRNRAKQQKKYHEQQATCRIAELRPVLVPTNQDANKKKRKNLALKHRALIMTIKSAIYLGCWGCIREVRFWQSAKSQDREIVGRRRTATETPHSTSEAQKPEEEK